MQIISKEEWRSRREKIEAQAFGTHQAQRPPMLLFQGVLNAKRITLYTHRGAAIQATMSQKGNVYIEMTDMLVRCFSNEVIPTADAFQPLNNMEMLECVASMSRNYKAVALHCHRATYDMLRSSGLPEIAICRSVSNISDDTDPECIARQESEAQAQMFFATASHETYAREGIAKTGARAFLTVKDDGERGEIFLSCDGIAQPIERIAVFSLRGDPHDILTPDELSLLRGWSGIVEDVLLTKDISERDVFQVSTTLSKAVSVIIMKLKAS